MVEKTAETPRRSLRDWVADLSGSLGDAAERLALGEAGEAEKHAKAISAVAKAVRDIADLDAASMAEAPEENVETVRAELRRRIARFVVADQAGASLEELERIANAEIPE